MSDTNRVTLNYVEEQTPGETPSNPVFRRLRFTGAPSLTFSPETVVSNEIAPGRQVQDLIAVGSSAGGGVNFELPFYDHDVPIAMAMFNTWDEQEHRVGDDITSVSADSMTVAAGNAAGGFGPGDIVRTLGFAVAANNLSNAVLETGSTDTTLNITGLEAEADPPDEAQVRKVGYEGSAGEFALSQNGSIWELGSSGFDFTADADLAVGDWVVLAGFDTANANGRFRVSSVAAGVLQFDEVPAGVTADDGVGDTVRVYFGDRLRNGTTDRTITIEERFTDHSPATIAYFRGERVGTMNLQLDSKAIVTGSYTFVGETAEYVAARVSGATDLAPLLLTPYNTSSNVAALRQSGAEVTGPNFALSISMQIENNLRPQAAVAYFGNVGVGAGEMSLTGTIETYFGDKSLVQQVVNGTETSYDMLLKDGGDHGLLFDVPRIKWTSGAPEVPGKNEDVTASLEYQALARDVADSYTLHIGRYWYLP